MGSKLWVFRDIDLTRREALAQALAISSATASLLLARGVTTLDEAAAWMSPGIVHDPFLIPDMDRAVDRLHQAMVNGERVCFYGDYDVDGMSATGIYLSFFQGLGANVSAYVPHRIREGYGLNEGAVRRLASEGVTLLVTSDCGTTSHREIALANQLGLDVIVTDHHQTDGELPPAVAVMNPHRRDARYPFHGLCSGGLAYKVACAYEARHGSGEVPTDALLDLVALSTIADVVPLQDENRVFVREGLAQLSRGARCGIRALKLVSGLANDCTADAIAFKLAPRLNAAGRLDEGLKGVRLLTTESEAEAKRLAEELDQLNRLRQRLESEIMRDATAAVEAGELPDAIVVASREWHMGVVGIVASRLVERFHRPAVVIALDGRGIGKGSARTIPGFDLYQGLASCRDLLLAFGGHPSAAGVTVHESRLSEFAGRFAAVAGRWAQAARRVPTLHLDSEVRLNEVTYRLLQEIGSLHPFGAGNPEPMFAGRRLEITNARVVGEKHLKMTLRQEGSPPFDGIGFGMKSLETQGVSLRDLVDVAFTPELNRWNGYDRIQLRIRDIRPSDGA
ncbi:single-stranded-DNA-specific exonuclease RecJ [Candidatus Nitrospira inopinata]|jgi:single-stranded-DNA-specific exonuclease|uniref:Single-stranded-DNA-specific exonuclease RecJ n=1 Tax=Candidatus Nitrospira inopinata TaxID=1715989 RepID=A0A0S4L0T2_9BACT|nr:single-stranded-DNA-specific exonuclease RecJ [Candidatus Nitrospira inopinata]CUQ68260.1 Single-stranded-DNA-specific exonuclease RecJ [Candidatus Nitrospira inopinata]